MRTLRPPTWALADAVLDAGHDLVLGSACVGCGAPGRVLCRHCAAALPRHGRQAWPAPTPPGLVVPYAAGSYDGLLKALVLEHKEHGVLALAAPLGRVLADVVHDLVGEQGAARSGGPVTLVPVPSRAAVVRSRGHDPMLRVAREAAARLRRRGTDAGVRRLLVSRGRVRDQSGLGAAERAVNLAGSMRCLRVGGWPADPSALVVLVDDVLTTGATAREGQRALESGGVPVAALAVLAATRRRLAGGRRRAGVFYRSGAETATVGPWSPSGSVVAPPDCCAGESPACGPRGPLARSPDG